MTMTKTELLAVTGGGPSLSYLQEADGLRGADLTGANLRGADLTGAK